MILPIPTLPSYTYLILLLSSTPFHIPFLKISLEKKGRLKKKKKK